MLGYSLISTKKLMAIYEKMAIFASIYKSNENANI